MFSQVNISLNGALITSSTNTYPYLTMLETLLSYGEDGKTSRLTFTLYYRDQAGTMDSIDFGNNAALRNDGLPFASHSRVFDMLIDRLHADIFSMT